MAAVEGPTGIWRMIDAQGVEYGRVEIRRVMGGQQVMYKAMRHGEVLGWATTLRLACGKVHGAYLAAMMPGGGPKADWGELTGNPRQRRVGVSRGSESSQSRVPQMVYIQ